MAKFKPAGAIIGSIFIAAGVVWSFMFPKTRDIFRPDFVASVAIGAGLIFAGLIILFLKKNRIVRGILSIFLIWSVLMNLFLFSYVKSSESLIDDMIKSGLNVSQGEPDIQEGDGP